MPIPGSKLRTTTKKSTPTSDTGYRHVLELMSNVHAAIRRRSPDAGALVRCAVQGQNQLRLADSALPSVFRQDGETPLTPIEWSRLGSALELKLTRSKATRSWLDEWTFQLAGMIGLDEAETRVLAFILAHNQESLIRRLWAEMSDNRGEGSLLRDDSGMMAMFLALPEADVRASLAPEGRLRMSGLLNVDDDGDVSLLNRLATRLVRRVPLHGDVRNHLVSPARKAELEWGAFKHLGELAERAVEVLAGTIAAREQGVSILLYGPPGTGKTAFAAALAERVGAALHPVGEADDDGGEPCRSERLAELRLSQRLLGGSGAVLLFDEAEDLFSSMPFERRSSSRVFLHRLLEQGRAPVIWTANSIDVLGPAMARRMMMCIEVRQPGAAVRATLLKEMAMEEGVALTQKDATEIARTVPAAPAVLRNALRATRLAGGGSDMARLVASSIARAVNGGCLPLPEGAADADYDPDLIQADCDLPGLVRDLMRLGAPRAVSMLLSGPPGTGKSAYARHIAGMMGLPVLMKRASDLLDAYVGGSEKQIAGAFAEARDTGAFLIFDEADSLLGDRRTAHQRWEVSQVNELLTWMENHPMPFACTTNLADKLDPASFRRFTFQARFGYLHLEQARKAFERFFALPAPDSLARVHQLTPADFALVRKRLAFQENISGPNELVTLLATISLGREGHRPIGFNA